MYEGVRGSFLVGIILVHAHTGEVLCTRRWLAGLRIEHMLKAKVAPNAHEECYGLTFAEIAHKNNVLDQQNTTSCP